MRRCAALLWVGMAIACGAATTPPVAPQPSTLVRPARSVHLRASFDDDPSTYIGRFVPDALSDDAVDESGAVATRCSAFIKPKVVNAAQELDEVMFASQKATGALGVPMVAHAEASHEASAALRVKYAITKKMQSEVDATGLERCCREQPDQCTKRYIGEFVRGSGQVYQQTGRADSAGGGASHQGVAGEVEVKDSIAWRRVSSFHDMFFAFQTSAGLTELAGAPAADDCGWCERIPSSLDGKFFCGVSPDAPSEAMSRDLAMRNAREQVVKYMGEYLSSRSKTEASLLRGYVDDTQLIAAGAEGFASRVKDQRWCKAQPANTPEGVRFRTRVLAFLPNDQLGPAARDAVEMLINKRRAASAITPEQERALRELVK